MLPPCETWKDYDRGYSYVAFIKCREANLEEPNLQQREAEIEAAEKAKQLVIDGVSRFAHLQFQTLNAGLRAYAVFSSAHFDKAGIYFAFTEEAKSDPPKSDNRMRDWKGNLTKLFCTKTHKLRDLAEVEWVRVFTRAMQRQLGLGDIYATEANIAAACEEENEEELKILMPKAAPLIDQGLELTMLPRLFKALHSECFKESERKQHRCWQQDGKGSK